MIEEVLEGPLFDTEADVKYVITENTVRGGEAVMRGMEQPRAPFSAQVLGRFRARKN